jgi:hypothetical protein
MSKVIIISTVSSDGAYSGLNTNWLNRLRTAVFSVFNAYQLNQTVLQTRFGLNTNSKHAHQARVNWLDMKNWEDCAMICIALCPAR